MKNISNVSWVAIATALISSLGHAAPAHAQDANDGASSGGLSEIVVTATKRSENLQDVPLAVSAISSSDLQNKGVFETSDLNNSIPNLQVSSPWGEQQPNFSIRGVGVGTEFNSNAASPVGVYVDEVYQTFRVTHGQQLFDMEQVEIVRGPQGTLYGRNTTGGAINFITRKPNLDGANGQLTVGYGRFDRRNVEAALELTPVPEKLGIRIAGTYVNSDPFIKNVLATGPVALSAGGVSGYNINEGRSPGGYRNWGIRGTIRWQPTDSVDILLKAYRAESKGGLESPIPFGQTKGEDTIDFLNPQFLFNGIFAAFAPSGLLPESYSREARGLGERELEVDGVGSGFQNAGGVVLNADIQLNDDLRLISVSGYDDGDYGQLPDGECDGTPLQLCGSGRYSDFYAINQDVRLDYSGDRLKFIVGAYYGYDKMKTANTPSYFNFLADVGAAIGLSPDFFNPGGAFNGAGLSAGSLPTGVVATQDFDQIRKSWAIYGEGSFELTETLKVTAGLRYTSDKAKFRNGYSIYNDYEGDARMIVVSDNRGPDGEFAPYFIDPIYDEVGNLIIPASTGPYPGGLNNNGSSKRLSGRLIVDWKPTEESLIYASYSRGYRAGTFNGYAYTNPRSVYFAPPEEVDAFEVGFKTRWLDNRLQLNGSFFYYDYKNQQGQVVDTSATANVTSLNGSLKGFELEALFQATDRLRLSATLGHLDSKYDSTPCPDGPVSGFPAQIGSCIASGTGPVNVGGNPFPYAADWSATIGVDWDVVDIGNGTLKVHGDANYTGQFYYDSFKDYSKGPLPSLVSGNFAEGEGKYWIMNSRITYDSEHFAVSLWGKNLTNKTYYPFGIAIESLFGNGYVSRGMPRTYGVEATYRF